MKSVFTLFLVGFWVISWSQTSQIEGKVQDEENIGLPSATVVLLQPTDSVMKYFAITDGQGGFVIKNVKPASYLLQVSFMGYRTYYQSVEVQSNPVQLGNITLELEQQLLDEVVISEDRVPIRINKDTIEYDAGAFQTQPNAAVEELLKRLPGVEVESDGNVKAQGKDVQQILVDGKEFFGKDPKIATKNLPADAIKNVQVYDKKSDLAEFTGVDDGVRDKTINLELKDSHKSGLFGNVTAGYGDQGRYLGKLNLNNFTKKTRLSYIGSLNNINQETFSIMDYFSLTGGLGGGFGGGRVRLEINTDDGAFPGGVQSGINTIYSSGLNLSHDFSKNTSLTASYFFNGTRNDLYQTVNEQQFLPTGNLFSDDLTDRLQKRYDHRVNLQFKSNIDSLQQIRLNTKVGFNDFNQNAESSSLNSNALGALLNSSTQNYLVDGNRTSWSIEGAYRRKLGKPGRFVALSGNVGQNDQDQQAFIDALNLYYSGGQESLSDTLNQEQNQRQKEINYQAQFNYTEPIGKNSLVEWTLQRGKDDRDIDQTVWDLLMIFP
nr:TonB-dependent receptor [Saprospiraceae bacterium]